MDAQIALFPLDRGRRALHRPRLGEQRLPRMTPQPRPGTPGAAVVLSYESDHRRREPRGLPAAAPADEPSAGSNAVFARGGLRAGSAVRLSGLSAGQQLLRCCGGKSVWVRPWVRVQEAAQQRAHLPASPLRGDRPPGPPGSDRARDTGASLSLTHTARALPVADSERPLDSPIPPIITEEWPGSSGSRCASQAAAARPPTLFHPCTLGRGARGMGAGGEVFVC